MQKPILIKGWWMSEYLVFFNGTDGPGCQVWAIGEHQALNKAIKQLGSLAKNATHAKKLNIIPYNIYAP